MPTGSIELNLPEALPCVLSQIACTLSTRLPECCSSCAYAGQDASPLEATSPRGVVALCSSLALMRTFALVTALLFSVRHHAGQSATAASRCKASSPAKRRCSCLDSSDDVHPLTGFAVDVLRCQKQSPRHMQALAACALTQPLLLLA